ncbi:MAG TPA: tetratricopeptide repeat protein [Euryarchaeota archaeon]|nr:tetratricopeptide repeat protein [Euryarchaeota archaeon]
MSCIRCGDVTEESAYLCEVCAETCFQDPIFFFSPNLIGDSLVERLRKQASALIRLGPISGGDVERIEGQSFIDTVRSFNPNRASQEEAADFFRIANFIMGQYGIPIYSDDPELMLAEDASKVISTIAQKIDALAKTYPSVGMSDVFLRMGMVYWGSSRSVLLRSGPVGWCRDKRRYTLSKALEYLRKIPKTDELHSLASKMSGFILLDAGAYAEAEHKLSNARKSFPEDLLLVRALAKTHFFLGNIDEAINLLDQAISVETRPEFWLERGEYLRKSGRHDEAIASYQQTIAIDSNQIRAYKALIYLLRNLGRDEDAVRFEADMKLALEPGAAAKLEELMQAEKLMATEGAATIRARHEPLMKPSKPKIQREAIKDLLKAAKEAVNQGDFDSAIEILKLHMTEKGGLDLASLILLARAYLYNGQFELASKSVDGLLRKEKNSAAGWYWKAKIAYAQGRWGAAIQHLNKATNILPTFVDAWVERGLIFLANEKFKDADESFEVALDIDMNDARAWIGRAKSMSKLNRWGAAIQCLDRFLELMPDSREGWLLKAELLLEKNKYQEAEKAFSRYLEMEPSDPKALCQRAIALHSMGLNDDAVKGFKSCLEIDPNNEQAVNWLKTLRGGGAPG